ncbi:MAG: 4Fe-4S binding protein [Myxococcota bacterium]
MKRTRRRAFALLWAAPAWFRSVIAGAGTLFDAKPVDAKFESRSRRPMLDAADAGAMRVPALIWSDAGEHGCTACQRCASICPSHCLDIVAAHPGVSGQVAAESFVADLSRCTGCGDCVAICPEGALRSEGTALHAASASNLVQDLISLRPSA